jgi:hypothetical protein
VSRRALACVALWLLAPAAGGLAQPVDLSGTWRLDEGASAIATGTTFVGLGGSAGVPVTLYVTQARNGTIVIGSDVNTSHARTYVPGAESVTPLGAGEVRVRSRWVENERALEAEGRESASAEPLRERLELAGDTLLVTIDRRAQRESDEVPGVSVLLYRRVAAELPCAQWSTPCREWSQASGGGSEPRP